MRAISMLILGTLALLVGGCGGASDEDEVRSAWEAAAQAVADANATDFCALVSDEGKTEIAQRAGGLSCESAVRLLASQLAARDKEAIRRAKITNVDVQGDEATVTYATSASLAKVGFTGGTAMRRVDGHWLLRDVR